MSTQALKHANRIRGLKPNARAVLMTLCAWHKRGGSVIATYPQISRHTGIAIRSISRHLLHLEKRLLLRRLACRIPGKMHLTEIELLFLEFVELQEKSSPSQKREPNRPQDDGQNGSPRNRFSNSLFSSPRRKLLDGEMEVDFRREPGVYCYCCEILGKDANQQSLFRPVMRFSEVLVERARHMTK